LGRSDCMRFPMPAARMTTFIGESWVGAKF
jgi:hypothetical protein